MSVIRKRAQNFSEEEKMRFLRLLQAKGNAIISKVTSHDLQTNRLKEEAWVKITNDLNATGHLMRTTDNLKKLWQKMKTEAKTFRSQRFNQIHGTGGGPSKKMDDPVLDLVVEITGRASTGIEFVEDSDTKTETTQTFTKTHFKESLSPEDDFMNGSSVDILDGSSAETEAHFELPQIIEEIEIPGAPIETPKRNLKRNRPIETNSNERSVQKTAKMKMNNSLAAERLKSEKEKCSLITLQREHMIELHQTRLQNEKTMFNLKMRIYQEILDKITDGQSVDPEIIKIVLTNENTHSQ